jgi:hypothetical protein
VSYPHVVAYCQKMGGCGAIRLSGRVGAQVALAISPQSSSDPAVAPFEPLGRRIGPHRSWDRTKRRQRLRRKAYVA